MRVIDSVRTITRREDLARWPRRMALCLVRGRVWRLGAARAGASNAAVSERLVQHRPFATPTGVRGDDRGRCGNPHHQARREPGRHRRLCGSRVARRPTKTSHRGMTAIDPATGDLSGPPSHSKTGIGSSRPTESTWSHGARPAPGRVSSISATTPRSRTGSERSHLRPTAASMSAIPVITASSDLEPAGTSSRRGDSFGTDDGAVRPDRQPGRRMAASVLCRETGSATTSRNSTQRGSSSARSGAEGGSRPLHGAGRGKEGSTRPTHRTPSARHSRWPCSGRTARERSKTDLTDAGGWPVSVTVDAAGNSYVSHRAGAVSRSRHSASLSHRPDRERHSSTFGRRRQMS